MSVMVRSAKKLSWFLKKSAAAAAESMAMVLMDPILSHMTGPYWSLRWARVRWGICPSWNMLPNRGHPGGPGGRRRLEAETLRWRRRRSTSGDKNKRMYHSEESLMAMFVGAGEDYWAKNLR